MVTKYPYIRQSLNTGDIVLFSGTSVASWAIRLFSGRMSHVGLIVRDEFTGTLSVLESAIHRGKKGVQLNPLGQRIKTYKGKVWIRQLVTKRTPAMIIALQTWIRDNRNTSYESGIGGLIELLAATFDFWPFNNKANPKRLFCAELAASIYQLWGLLPTFPPANEFTPTDFCFNVYIDSLLKRSPEAACLTKGVQVR